MSLSLVLFLLASSFFWSVFDLCRKKATQTLGVFFTLFAFMSVQACLFLIWAGVMKDTSFLSSYWLIGLLGLCANFAANSLFVYSVSISSFSQSVPMLSFAPVFSVLVSYFLLGEVLTVKQLSGVFAIVLGALLLNGIPSFHLDKRGPLMM
ncbi:EamA family transporter, partial [bacterium]|nr:EamA family transporter [bacterium]